MYVYIQICTLNIYKPQHLNGTLSIFSPSNSISNLTASLRYMGLFAFNENLIVLKCTCGGGVNVNPEHAWSLLVAPSPY